MPSLTAATVFIASRARPAKVRLPTIALCGWGSVNGFSGIRPEMVSRTILVALATWSLSSQIAWSHQWSNNRSYLVRWRSYAAWMTSLFPHNAYTRGEAFGLRWSDVNLENGTAAVV